jgi:hypothetical protein
VKQELLQEVYRLRSDPYRRRHLHFTSTRRRAHNITLDLIQTGIMSVIIATSCLSRFAAGARSFLGWVKVAHLPNSLATACFAGGVEKKLAAEILPKLRGFTNFVLINLGFFRNNS